MKTVFVVSFRYTDETENLIGGDGAFLAELLPHLENRAEFRVIVVALKSRGTESKLRSEGATTVRLEARNSSARSLMEIHALPEPEVVSMGQAFGEQAFDFVARNGREGDLCILNDFFENGDVRVLKKRGLQVIQLCHLLASEYVFREYMKDSFAGLAELRKRFPLWMCKMIEISARRLRTHRQLVAFYDALIRSSVHGLIPKTLRAPFVREHESFHRSDRVIVPTQQMKSTIHACYPRVPSDRVEVVPWGLTHPLPAENAAEEIASIRSQYQIAPEDRVLVTLSRISPEKGLEYLFQALALIERDHPETARGLVVFVCGRPTMPRGEDYFAELKRLAAGLKLCRVHFPGFVSGIRKSAFFYCGDLYVFPSKYESFGLSLVEAMSHGLAVVASDSDGSRDIVKPEFGIRVPFAEPRSRARRLKTAILTLLESDLKVARRHALAESQRYSWELVADRLLSQE